MGSHAYMPADTPVAVLIKPLRPHRDDLWQDLRKSFALPHYENNPLVQKQIKWFLNNPTLMDTFAKHSTPYLYYIKHELEARKLPGEIALLPFIESAYDPFAYSVVGAAGLWQLMPGTASGLGLNQDWWFDARRDIPASTKAALDYLSYLNDVFDGNWLLALAAYNSGAGTIQEAIRRDPGSTIKEPHLWELKLPHETRTYLQRILALSILIEQPGRHAIELPPVKNQPYFTAVKLDTQIELALAAKLAGITTTEFIRLNPGFHQWATQPTGSFELLIPYQKAAAFREKLKQMPKTKYVTWQQYKIKDGDTLGKIAKHTHMSLNTIRQFNHFKNNKIVVGHTLKLPPKDSQRKTQNILKKFVKAASAKHRYPPKQIMHTVKRGQSTKAIARRYGVSRHEVRFWNQITGDNKPKTGQRLVIWKRQHRPSHSGYRIKPGDTLLGIALKKHVSVKSLMKKNHIKNVDKIRVGMLIRT